MHFFSAERMSCQSALVKLHSPAFANVEQSADISLNRLLKYSPTCGLPPLALALFFRQVSVS